MLPGHLHIHHHSRARVVAAACDTFLMATFQQQIFSPAEDRKNIFCFASVLYQNIYHMATFSAVFSARSNTSAIYGVITGTEVKVVTYREIRDI